METYKEIDKIVLWHGTKHCLHAALSHYYLLLKDAEPSFNALPVNERLGFLVDYQECKRLLQEVFADPIVKPDNTHDLPF